jgi:hypothetical protein
MADEYYEISPKLSDIDFYIGQTNAQSTVSINSDVTTSAVSVATASSSISITSSVNISNPKKVIGASSEVEIQLICESTPLEILNVLTLIHSTVSVSVTSQKTTNASSSISISLDTSVSALKITSALAFADITTAVTPTSKKIAKASASSNITAIPAFHSTLISYMRQQVSIQSRVIINAPIRFSPSYIDSSSHRTLLILDGKPLTDHGRTFEESLSPVFVESSNWNNRKSRYYKRATSSGRKNFTINWANVPNAMEDTVDSRHGRDYIISIAEDPDAHELKVINLDASGTTPYTETTYTVFVTTYSETLSRRYLSEDVYLYQLNLSLEEA